MWHHIWKRDAAKNRAQHAPTSIATHGERDTADIGIFTDDDDDDVEVNDVDESYINIDVDISCILSSI